MHCILKYFFFQNVAEENLKFEKLTKRSLELRIVDLEQKDYVFVINNLLDHIIEEKCYWKLKTDMVVIYLRKAKEGVKWDYITTIEKRIKDKKANELGENADVESNDPGAGLMNIMKKMYQSGDSEMKQVIAKAWTEAQEKRDKDGIQF
jgi:calcyclin binding protein